MPRDKEAAQKKVTRPPVRPALSLGLEPSGDPDALHNVQAKPLPWAGPVEACTLNGHVILGAGPEATTPAGPLTRVLTPSRAGQVLTANGKWIVALALMARDNPLHAEAHLRTVQDHATAAFERGDTAEAHRILGWTSGRRGGRGRGKSNKIPRGLTDHYLNRVTKAAGGIVVPPTQEGRDAFAEIKRGVVWALVREYAESHGFNYVEAANHIRKDINVRHGRTESGYFAGLRPPKHGKK